MIEERKRLTTPKKRRSFSAPEGCAKYGLAAASWHLHAQLLGLW